jgi:hypothetical protein
MEHLKYKKVSLPEMPDNIKQDLANDVARARMHDEDLGWNRSSSYHNRTVQFNNKNVQSCRTHHSHLSDSVENWIRENVVPHWLYATIAITHPVSNLHGMHTDRTRRYVLLYIVERGGDDVVARLYQEKGQPITRFANNTNQVLITDYNQHEFEILDESRAQPGEWVIFDSKILHDIQNIEKERVAIHISLDSNFDLDTWTYTDQSGDFKSEDFYKAL